MNITAGNIPKNLLRGSFSFTENESGLKLRPVHNHGDSVSLSGTKTNSNEDLREAAKRLLQNIAIKAERTWEFGGGVAKGAAKIVVGGLLGAAVGAGKGIIKGSGAAGDAASKGLMITEEDKKTSLPAKTADVALKVAPALGAAVAFSAGMAPAAMIVAAFMAPGAIGGTASAVKGAAKGAVKGVDFALGVSRKADEAVTKRLGRYAGKAAQLATGVAAGLVAVPVAAFTNSINEGFRFAERAIGVRENPETAKEAFDNLAVETAVVTGAVVGIAASGGGVAAMATGVASGAGAMATFIKGTAAAAEGFMDGAVKGYMAADQAIDTITG